MLAEGITYTAFSSSEYLDLLKHGSELLKKCASWRLAFINREKVTARLRRAMRDLELPALELVSACGPVEASISWGRVRLNYQDACEDVSNVTGESFRGHMMPNYSVVIVDKDLRPIPIGYPGEICIAGPGLAKGYLNNPDEDSRRFFNNPFASADDIIEGRARLFRSGDKGRVLEDGSVHFIGPMESDREITIEDKRVNLDEIADVIIREASPAIIDAAVSWREEPGMLFAFVTLAEEPIDGIDVFLRRLRATVTLPRHMIPDVILPVNFLPRTLNGTKDFHAIDKLVLPEDIPGRVATEFFSPLEMRVKSIWKSLIITNSMADLKPESDFFCAGGNSLLLIPLQAALQSEVGCSLSMPDIFQFSTIRSMGACIQGRVGEAEGLLGG